MYLLDSNHCSSIINKNAEVIKRLDLLPRETVIAINTIILGELIFMVDKSERKRENLQNLQLFINSLREFIYPIDDETSKIYGQLCTEVFNFYAPKEKNKRRKFEIKDAGIYQNDLWIACTAIQHNLTIVSTDNDFLNISKASPLKLDCWIANS